jgi:hypothetical protein
MLDTTNRNQSETIRFWENGVLEKPEPEICTAQKAFNQESGARWC